MSALRKKIRRLLQTELDFQRGQGKKQVDLDQMASVLEIFIQERVNFTPENSTNEYH